MIALTLALLATPAVPDVLCLTDGRIITDRNLSRKDGGVEVLYDNGDVFVPQALISACVIEGEDPLAAHDGEVKDGRVSFEGRWVTPGQRQKEIERRVQALREAAADAQAHSEWRDRYIEETRYFAFEHTLPLDIFENYRDLMEAYFAAFLKDWRIKKPKGQDRLTVCFYRNRKDFQKTSGAGPYTLGYFRFVEPMELDIFYDRQDEPLTVEVMFHESNHYLQKLIDLEFSYPHFPGEALAEYYGASHWDREKKKLSIGHVLEGRLVEIQMDILKDEWMTIDELVGTDRLYEHYTWGWSLVHFLMNHKKYESKFRKFFMALPSGKDVKRVRTGHNLKTVEGTEVLAAFKKYLGLKKIEDVRKLEMEWHAYIEENLGVATLHGKEYAAKAALRNGLKLRAKRLFGEAIAENTTNAFTYHSLAKLRVRDDDGGREEALQLWRKAIELDPLEADFYSHLGYHMKRAANGLDGEAKDAQVAEGARLMKLALELDPRNQLAKGLDLEKLEKELEEEEG